MAQQHINYGAQPDDGTGDDLRTFASKSQANFSELYGAVGQSGGGPSGDGFPNVSALLADTGMAYSSGSPTVSAGQIVRTLAEGFAYQVAASGASNHHVTTAGGVKLYVLEGDRGFNVLAFGANRSDSGNQAPIFEKAFDAAQAAGSRTVYVPRGVYRTTETIYLRARLRLVGENQFYTTIKGAGVSGAVINSNPNPHFTNGSQTVSCSLEDIAIGGTATHGVIFAWSPRSFMRNVWVRGNIGGDGLAFSGENGFIFEGVWSCSYQNLSTIGANLTNYCFWFGCDVNACNFDGLQTSNAGTVANFVSRSANSITGYGKNTPMGHGNVLNNICAQGGEIGIHLRDTGYGGWTINGVYMEAIKHPFVLGDSGSSALCRSVTINSPLILGRGSGSTAAFIIHRAYNVTVNACEFGNYGESGTDFVHYREAQRVIFNGFWSSGSSTFTDKIKRLDSTNSQCGIIYNGEEGSGTSNKSTLLMTRGTSGGRMYKMTIDGNGNWVSDAVDVPTV